LHARDRQRSLVLDTLAPLLALDGVRWFSLQKGPAAAALKDSTSARAIVDAGEALVDYADTAAAIAELDLVVTVDTSVAHLAGALGRAVWVLLPTPADWRWLEGRDDSPWYPTMRLFRQTKAGAWPEVIERVRAALVALRDGSTSEGGKGTELSRPQAQYTESLRGESLRELAVQSAATAATPAAHPATPAIHRLPRGVARARWTRVGIIECFPDGDPASISVAHYGEWLEPQIDLLRRLVPPNAVVVEVAAGIGYHALALAPLAGEGGQVLAIEGVSALRRALRENVAASDRRGVSVMPANVAGVTLDALAFERADLVKVDVAACAKALFNESADTLWRLRPMLFVAQSSQDTLDALAARVIDFGYRCWSVDCPLFNPKNFNCRDDDIFAGAGSLALLAVPEERDLAPPTGIAAAIAPVTA
ncbi:MAG: hypothetical protein ACREX6_12400, partial [Casimicrobiaceae bacterium]